MTENERVLELEEFYHKCAEILDVEIQFKPFVPFEKRDRKTGEKYIVRTPKTRWGGREPGNGRFPGYGVIRRWGDVYHIMFHHPISITTSFKTVDAVYDFLRDLKNQ